MASDRSSARSHTSRRRPAAERGAGGHTPSRRIAAAWSEGSSGDYRGRGVPAAETFGPIEMSRMVLVSNDPVRADQDQIPGIGGHTSVAELALERQPIERPALDATIQALA